MMNLAVAQIEMAMKEGDDSVDALADSFTTMAGEVRVIDISYQKLNRDNLEQLRADIGERCGRVSAKMASAIVALQFYDRLTQRLAHVGNSLRSLTELVESPIRLYNPIEWQALQEKLRSKYTMEEERLMFDVLMDGATVNEALDEYRKRLTQKPQDDVELF